MSAKLKVLVTGGGGFLGGYILRDLVRSDRYEVFATKRTHITRSIFKDPQEQVTWLESDLLDVPALSEAIENIDIVIHCAAKVSYHRSQRKEMYQVNQNGTANLINCALDEGVKKIIHISSIAAIGRPPQVRQLDEQVEWVSSSNNSHYAVTKKLAELEVFRGFGEGLEGTILNPSIVLGTGYWDQGTALIFKKVFDGLNVYPSGHTGFVDVRDVSAAVLRAIELPSYNNRIILNGSNMSYHEILSRIARLFDKKPPGRMLKKSMVHWLKPLALAAEYVLGNVWSYTAEILGNTAYQYTYRNDLSKQILDLNYRPLETTLEDITTIWKMDYPHEATMLED